MPRFRLADVLLVMAFIASVFGVLRCCFVIEANEVIATSVLGAVSVSALALRRWLIAIIGGCIIVAVFLRPAITSNPGDPLQNECKDQLQHIASALMEYKEANGTFPPQAVVSPNGHAHSWRVLLLPYLGYQYEYYDYDFDKAWNDESNQKNAGRVSIYTCPSDQTIYETNYVYVSSANSTGAVRAANSILVGEIRATGIHWMQPKDVESVEACGSYHQGEYHVILSDGSVRFIEQ